LVEFERGRRRLTFVCFDTRRAKTDVYVGFLPAEALERLLERRPIVLLTLAKRLISLLSPLGELLPLLFTPERN